MTPSDDFTEEVFGLFWESTADALLEGRVEPQDAPPALQGVARLVLAARSLPASRDLAVEDSVVAAFVERVSAPNPEDGRHRTVGPMFSAKVAGVAFALALAGTTAAAATGTLPASIQSAVSRGLSHVGISVPDPGSGASHAHGPDGHGGPIGTVTTTTGRGGSTSAAAAATAAATAAANVYGLCTAYLASDSGASGTTTHGKALSSTAFARLNADAQAKGETVQAFCASVPTPGSSSTTSTTGTTTSTANTTSGAGSSTGSGGSSSKGSGGKPATNPAGKTPGPPATNPAGKTPGAGSSNNGKSSQAPGAPATTPAGTTPSSTSATNPEGKTTGPPATNPAGKTPGAGSSNNNGKSSEAPGHSGS